MGSAPAGAGPYVKECGRGRPDRDSRSRDRARSARPSGRGAARPRLPSSRADRPRRRDRLRRSRLGRRPADRLDRHAGGRHATGSSGATTRRASATPSARTPGSSYLFPAADPALARERDGEELRGRGGAARRRRRSRFIGVRSCELHAIAIQDRVFIGGKLRRPRLRGRAARTRSSSRSTASSRRAPASAPRWAPARSVEAGYDLALTELLDGEHRLLVEAGTERGAEVLARAPAAAGRAADRTPRAEAASTRPPRRWPGASTPTTSATSSPQPRPPALGRRRRPLPDLRQLHARLPDLLLLDRRGRHRPRRRRGRAHAGLGHLLLGRLLLHPRGQRPAVRPLALPAVDDPQARHLARPVRLARAASAAGAASPGARSGSTSPKSSAAIRATGRRATMETA